MGDPVTATVAVASLASVGLSAASKGVQAQGVAEGDEFKAQQLDEAATYGELKAQQTNAQLTRNLAVTLGNIDAVRAAGHGDPSDPSNAAVRDYVEETQTTAKNTQVDTIMQQARQDEAGAAYERDAASSALLAGDLSIGGTILGGLSGAMKGGG